MALLMTASALAVVLMFLTLLPCTCARSGDDGIVKDSMRSPVVLTFLTLMPLLVMMALLRTASALGCVNVLGAAASCPCAQW